MSPSILYILTYRSTDGAQRTLNVAAVIIPEAPGATELMHWAEVVLDDKLQFMKNNFHAGRVPERDVVTSEMAVQVVQRFLRSL